MNASNRRTSSTQRGTLLEDQQQFLRPLAGAAAVLQRGTQRFAGNRSYSLPELLQAPIKALLLPSAINSWVMQTARTRTKAWICGISQPLDNVQPQHNHRQPRYASDITCIVIQPSIDNPVTRKIDTPLVAEKTQRKIKQGLYKYQAKKTIAILSYIN